MKIFQTILIFYIAMLSTATSVLADDDANDIPLYTVKPGDILFVSVWKEPELSLTVLIRPDGRATVPLAGEINTYMKTLPEVQEIITERFSQYLSDPVVTVSLNSLNGNKIYVIGQVARPGEFVATRNIDVLQALSVSGGLGPFAAANKIKILRRTNGVLHSIPFRYGDIEKGKNLEQNIILQSGDVLLIP